MTTEREEDLSASERRTTAATEARARPGDDAGGADGLSRAKSKGIAPKKKKVRFPKYSEPNDPPPAWVKRLEEAIKRAGMSLREVSRRVAVQTDGTTVGEGLIAQWISGRNRRVEFQKMLAALKALPDTNAWYVMTGVGEIDAPNPAPLPKQLAQLFESDKKLSATVRRAVVTFLAKHPDEELADDDVEAIAREFTAAEYRARKIVEEAARVRAAGEIEGSIRDRRRQRLQASDPVEGERAKAPLAKARKEPR